MLLSIGALISLIAAASVIRRVYAARVRNTAELGWMSERWLAEYRASHPS
jgi:hypothetical protein